MMDNAEQKQSRQATVPLLHTYDKWQEALLKGLLRGALVFGLAALVPAIFEASTVVAAIYLAAYLSLLIASFAPLPYRLRAWIFLAILYGLGISNLLEEGLYGGARLFFMAFAAIAALLLSQRTARNAVIGSVLTIALVGWQVFSGRLRLANEQIPTGDLAVWISFTLAYVLLSAVIIIGVGMFRSEVNRSRKQTEETIELLTMERASLEERVSERTASLERRNINLQAITNFSQLISQARREETILEQTVQLISEQLGHEYVGVFLLDQQGENAILRAANTEAGQSLISRNYQLRVMREEILYGLPEETTLVFRVGNKNIRISSPALLNNMNFSLNLPIISGNQMFGLLNIQSSAANMDAEEQAVLQAIAGQVAIALENARLFDRLRMQLHEIEQMTGEAIQEAWRKVGAGMPVGYQYDRIQVLPAGEELPAEVVRQLREGQTVSYVTAGEKQASRLIAPIMLRGQVIGVIGYEEADPGHVWERDNITFLETVASQVGITMENARLIAEAQQRARQEELISKVASRVRETLDMDTVLQTAILEMRRSLGLKEAEVCLRPAAPAEKPTEDNAP